MSMEEDINRIAHDLLGLERLDVRKSDRLDFHELPVWSIREALVAAYRAGQAKSGGKP